MSLCFSSINHQNVQHFAHLGFFRYTDSIEEKHCDMHYLSKDEHCTNRPSMLKNCLQYCKSSVYMYIFVCCVYVCMRLYVCVHTYIHVLLYDSNE